ncbi:hypothetical protein QOZ80_1AG0044140 [Eleusine coracana subsp. coracana]|nr:hypothetical protein QOZ80_1AG0044140 [Eleusine coracana subsp. coracana]
MAARKISNAAAMALAVAVVAMLVVAATAQCGVDRTQVMNSCLGYCKNGGGVDHCCHALSNANVKCLCHSYWDMLKGSSFYSCAMDIQKRCRLPGCPN